MPKPKTADEKRPVPAHAISFDPDALDALLKEPIQRTLYEEVSTAKRPAKPGKR